MQKIYSPNTKLTKNFKYKELNPHDFPCKEFINENLFRMALFLECLRIAFGKPIIVTSGYRTPKYNATLPNASPNSYHMLGKAVDITSQLPQDLETLYMCLYRLKIPFSHYFKVDYKRNYIHIQLGERDESVLDIFPYYPFN